MKRRCAELGTQVSWSGIRRAADPYASGVEIIGRVVSVIRSL